MQDLAYFRTLLLQTSKTGQSPVSRARAVLTPVVMAARHVTLPAPELPADVTPLQYRPDDAHAQRLVQDHGLRHGDLVTFGDVHRWVPSFWVLQTDTGTSLQPNPDDSGSGYLTITREVLAGETHSHARYGVLISAVPAVNLHLGSRDAWIREHLGVQALPQVELQYAGGDLDLVVIGDREFTCMELQQAREYAQTLAPAAE